MLILDTAGLQIRPSGIFLVLHYKCLYSIRPDCKSDRAESFLFCITNAYIRYGRIANPTERNLSCFALQMLILDAAGLQIRPSGVFLVFALQMLILDAAGLQIRPSGCHSLSCFALQMLILGAAGLQIRPSGVSTSKSSNNM